MRDVREAARIAVLSRASLNRRPCVERTAAVHSADDFVEGTRCREVSPSTREEREAVAPCDDVRDVREIDASCFRAFGAAPERHIRDREAYGEVVASRQRVVEHGQKACELALREGDDARVRGFAARRLVPAPLRAFIDFIKAMPAP